jgi:hypothetical protein
MTTSRHTDKAEQLSTTQIVEMLVDAGQKSDFVPLQLRGALSNLSPEAMTAIKGVWGQIAPERREAIIFALLEESEDRFDCDYDQIGHFALTDTHPSVRKRAIDLLWIDESPELLRRLMQIAQVDDDAGVRAEAVSALGRFVLLGEYEEIPQAEVTRLSDLLHTIWFDEREDLLVRRRALESLGNSSVAGINDLIADAYDSSDSEVRVSAIFAMGKTCDRDRWGETIRRELTSTDDATRYEAVRAAGELELRQSVPTLHSMALNDNSEIRKAAIWALGEIGGTQAQNYLSAIADIIEEAGNDPELEALITEAIENATLPSLLDIDDWAEAADWDDDEWDDKES